MMKRIFIPVLALIILLWGCKKDEPQNPDAAGAGQYRTVTVKEVVNVPQYTYLRVDENGTELWMAVPRIEAAEGTTLYFSKFTEMKNFQSPGMKKTFESILFVEDISTTKPGQQAQQGENKPMKPVIEKTDVSVEKAKGGITIAQLFSDAKSYENKTAVINGKVTKMNTGIMGKTWLHIQDGTSAGNDFDLTVTTESEAAVGDIVQVKGKIILNKDFGYGYSYKVLMEDATVAKIK